ncbi:MAG: class I SAM-dependent methyltransferase [Sphingobium sp.]|nr:class I SAM-dependent methyltransferase [Sphingobium sp.]
MKPLAGFALTALALLAAAPLAAQTVSPALKAALADPGRPAKDSARDAVRHPGEMLALANIKPGDKVGDFMMGAGYWTRILAKTVGDKGHVYAYQAAEFIGYRPAYADEQKAAVTGYTNVTPLAMKLGEVAFPEKLDAIVTVQNFHDLYLPFGGGPDFAVVVTKRLYDALKPGGIFLVADHVAVNDPDNKAPATLHRIEPAKARAEIEKAGFVFVTQSDIIRDKADPHTANVFSPAIQGKTDQFVMVFRKP